MKILHVIPGLAAYMGGPPHGLRSLALAQIDQGDTVTVLSCSDRPGDQVLPAGTTGNLTVTVVKRPDVSLLANPDLDRALAELVPLADVVHIHGTWRYHCWGTARIARKHGVPYIVRPAGNLGELPRAGKGLRKAIYWQLFDKRAVNQAAAVHCCSEKERREIVGLNIRSPLKVIPMPLDGRLLKHQPDMDALAQLCPQLRPEHRVVLFLARISAIKRPHVLLDAFRSIAAGFPDAVLMFAGPKEDTAIIRGLTDAAASAGLTDRVLFTGMVTGPLKAACFRRAAAFALPSAHENFGQSVAEAIAFGLPCVVSEGVALADEIVEHGAGFRCPSDPDSFAAALRTLLSDPSLCRRQGQAAAQLAERYMPAPVCRQLRQLYESFGPAARGTRP